jgi:pimeloyl-ACP methyl ester carboxylesterase
MKRIKVHDVELACRDEGWGAPLILLHAFPLTQRMWDEQVMEFAARQRVVTFDWRGFGLSTLGDGSSTMEVFADDLAGLMDALAIEQATVCGLSMGGYAAFAFYRKYAERVAALILADTRAGTDTEEGKRGRYEMAELARRSGPSALVEKMLPKLLGPTTQQTKPQIVERVQAMIDGNNAEGIARALFGMAERADSTELLPRISCPALVIVGSEDGITPLSEAEKMSQAIPNARLVKIESSGHLSNLEQPDEFNRAVAGFLKEM